MVLPGVEQWSDSKSVTTQIEVELSLLGYCIEDGIKNGKRELSIKFFRHGVYSMVLKERKEDFDVRMGFEDVILFGLDLSLQFCVVVDLAIAQYVYRP